jgi:hypothetical protein
MCTFHKIWDITKLFYNITPAVEVFKHYWEKSNVLPNIYRFYCVVLISKLYYMR